MSHLYNPYDPENEGCAQTQYGHSSAQADRDPQRTSLPNPGTSYRPPPAGPSAHNSHATIPPLMALPMSCFTSVKCQPTKADEMSSSQDAQVSRAREEPMHLPLGRDSLFPGTRKDNFLSTPSEVGSYMKSKSSQGPSKSLDWVATFKSANEDKGSNYYSSAASSSFPSSGEGTFMSTGERKSHEQSIPGLGYYEFPGQQNTSTQPKYTSESASNILSQFGLEKEDLEQLISYPEDQITAQNLPFILRQIRLQKTKNSQSAAKAEPYVEPKGHTPMKDKDIRGHSHDETSHQEFRPRGILKQSKVIDYGHISKYSEALVDETGRMTGSSSLGVGGSGTLMDSSSREAREIDISSLMSSRDQGSSLPGLGSSYGSKLSSTSLSTSNPAKQFQSLPTQVHQTTPIPFTLPTKDTDSRILPGLSKELLKGLESCQLESLKPFLSDIPTHSSASGQHGVVLFDSRKDPHKARVPASNIPEQQPAKQDGKKQLAGQKGLASQVQSAPHQPGDSFSTWNAPIPSLLTLDNVHGQPSTSGLQPPSRESASSLPVAAQLYEDATGTPRMFPHTCSLCKKEYFSVKEWLNHQTSVLHQENCKGLQARTPKWESEHLSSWSTSDREGTFSSTRPRTSHKSRRNSRSPVASRYHDRRSSTSRSRSWSYSPPRYRGTEGRRETDRGRRISRSRSRSYSPRRHYSSEDQRDRRRRRRSRSHSHSYSHQPSSKKTRRSRSHERQSSQRRRDDRRSPASWSTERRSSSLQKQSVGAEALAQKLLESSAVQALSNQSDLEAVVKTLAPALLAELNKLKSPSSSSSSNTSKEQTAKLSSPASKIKNSKTQCDSAAVTVRLVGVRACISHPDLEGIARAFGKPKSVVIYRKLEQAQVTFEKPEEAEKLRRAKSQQLMGMKVIPSSFAMTTSQSFSQEPKKVPQTKTQKSNVSTSKVNVSSSFKNDPATPTTKGKTPATTPKQSAASAKASSVMSQKPLENPKKPPVPNTAAKHPKGAPGSKTPVSAAKKENTPKTTKSSNFVKAPDPPAKAKAPDPPAKAKAPDPAAKAKAPDLPAKAPDPSAKAKAPDPSGKATDPSGKAPDPSAKAKAPDPSGKAPDPSAKVADKLAIVCDPLARPSNPTTKAMEKVPNAEIPASPQISHKKMADHNVPETLPLQVVGEGTTVQKVQEEVGTPEMEAAASEDQASAAAPLTKGEMMGKYLLLKRIACLPINSIVSLDFSPKDKRVLHITNLPKYQDNGYTEQDLVDLLTPFGFQRENETIHNIYIIPQKRMAFVILPTVQMVRDIVRASLKNTLDFFGIKLCARILRNNLSSPLDFYSALMYWMNVKTSPSFARSLVFIKNITPSEARNLREILKKIDSVKIYAPLLYKVFIEFESEQDADRLGVWYSLLKNAPQHQVYRLSTPRGPEFATPPRLAVNAFPDVQEQVSGATIPNKGGQMSGCPNMCPPFYVTMTMFPFLFPTASPWFLIPVCQKIPTNNTGPHAVSTLMLAPLPEDGYTQLDVAHLIWPWIQKKNQTLHTLLYKVIVLPLQRRAFVLFEDTALCNKWVRRHTSKPFTIKGQPIKASFVRQNLQPGFNEETMYRCMMKWSNAHVPELKFLGQRLLLVQVSEVSLELIQAVMKEVTSVVGRVAGFLPLANRICIEMFLDSDVRKVISSPTLGSGTAPKIWQKVLRVERVSSQQHRVFRSNNARITLNEEPSLTQTPTAQPKAGVRSSTAASSSSTKPPAALAEQSSSKTSQDMKQVGKGSSRADGTGSNDSVSDGQTSGPPLSLNVLEGPKPSEEIVEGPKPSEKPSNEPRQSEKLCDEQTPSAKPSEEPLKVLEPSEQLLEVPKPSKQHLESAEPSEQCPEGLKPSEQPPKGSELSEQRPEGPEPPEQHFEGLESSEQCHEGPELSEQCLKGPEPTEQNIEGPKSSEEQLEGPTSILKCSEDLKTEQLPGNHEGLTKQQAEGLSCSKAISEGPKLSKEHPEIVTPAVKPLQGPTSCKNPQQFSTFSEKPAECFTASEKLPKDSRPPEESFEGPKASEELLADPTQSHKSTKPPKELFECPQPPQRLLEGSSSSEEGLPGSTTSMQPKTDSEESSVMKQDDGKAILASTKQHQQAPDRKIPMDFMSESEFVEKNYLCFEAGMDEFVTLDEVTDDSKDSSMQPSTETMESPAEFSKSSNQSTSASVGSHSPSVSERRLKDLRTPRSRYMSRSPERRSQRKRDKSRSPERRSSRSKDMSRSPDRRYHRSLEKSRGSEHKSHHGKGTSNEDREKSLSTKHKLQPGREESPSTKRKGMSPSTEKKEISQITESKTNLSKDMASSTECKEKPPTTESGKPPGTKSGMPLDTKGEFKLETEKPLKMECKSDQDANEYQTKSLAAPSGVSLDMSPTGTAATKEEQSVEGPKEQETSVTQSPTRDNQDEWEEDLEKYQILDSIEEKTEDNEDLHSPTAEKDLSFDAGSFQVLDSIDDEALANQEESAEPQMHSTFQVLDSITEDQSATDHVEVGAVEQSSAEDPNKETKITKRPRIGKWGRRRKPAKVLSADTDTADQDSLDVKDSGESLPKTEDMKEKNQPLKDVTSETQFGPIKDEEVNQVIDAVEEHLAPNTKKKQSQTGMPTRRSMRGRTAKAKTEEHQDDTPAKAGMTKQDPIPDNRASAEASCNSASDGKIQDTERSERRRSGRGSKVELHTSHTPSSTTETKLQVINSVEDGAAPEQAVTATRSTRGRKGRPVKREEFPTTIERAGQECEEGPTTSVKAERIEVTVEDVAYKVIDCVENEAAVDSEPVLGQKRKRGRPKKNTKAVGKPVTAKKAKMELKQEPAYQIIDSVEEDQLISNKPEMTELSTSNHDRAEDKSTASVWEEDNEEPTYKIIDSVEEEQVQQDSEDSPVPVESTTAETNKEQSNTDFTEGEKRESSALGCTEAKEEGRNQEGPKGLSSNTGPRLGRKEIEMTEDDSLDLLTLDEVVADDAPEERDQDISERVEETNQETSRRNSSSEEPKNQDIEMIEEGPQELLTLDEVGADEAPEKQEDCSEERTGVMTEQLWRQSSPQNGRHKEGMQMTEVDIQELLTLDEVVADETLEEQDQDTSERVEETNREEASSRHSSPEELNNNREMIEEGPQELLTLDEVGADEAPEKQEDCSEERNGKMTEQSWKQSSRHDERWTEGMQMTGVDIQELLTLDEVVADDGPEEKQAEGPQKQEELNPDEEGQRSPASSGRGERDKENTEVDVQEIRTLDEVGVHESPKKAPEGLTPSEELNWEAELSRGGVSKEEPMVELDTQELLTLDEVGDDDAPEQPKAEEEKEGLSVLDQGTGQPTGDHGPARQPLDSQTLVTAEEKDDEQNADGTDDRHADDSEEENDFMTLDETREDDATLDEAVASLMQPMSVTEAESGGQSEKGSAPSIKAGGKRRKELGRTEAKRCRSRSPVLPADFTLPAYDPGTPLGREFVVPKSGFFCNLCSVFYTKESSAKGVHCSSQRHYDNLKKYYLKLQKSPSGASSPSSSNFSSDGV